MRRIFFLLVMVCPALLAVEVPTGVYDFVAYPTINTPVISDPNVDGVVIAAPWADLEPSKNTYVFNVASGGADNLAFIISEAEAAGKKMKLQIGMAPDQRPTWLDGEIAADTYAAAKYFTWDPDLAAGPLPPITIPVPWEPTLLDRHKKLIEALAVFLAAHPTVIAIQCPIMNANTNDFNPGSISTTVDGVAPTGSSPKSRWIAAMVGSPHANMGAGVIYAGNYLFAAYHAAMPNMLISTNLGRIADPPGWELNPAGNGNNGFNVSRDVLLQGQSLWPGHVACQKNSLNSNTPVAPGIVGGVNTVWNDMYVLDTIPHGTQNTWHAYDDSSCDSDPGAPYRTARMNGSPQAPCIDSTLALKGAVDKGFSYNTQWQEIYEVDVRALGSNNLDPDPFTPKNVIAYAQNLMAPTEGTGGGGKTLQSARKGILMR